MAGTCTLFCPPEEVEHRTRLELIHPCEAECGILVKRYARHGAGDEEQPPSALRPLHTLVRCQRHLVDRVLPGPPSSSSSSSLPLSTRYEFLSDRMRAIRQDIVIQGFKEDAELVGMLFEQLRFHALSGYLFAGGALLSSDDDTLSPASAFDNEGPSSSSGSSFDPALNDSRIADIIGLLHATIPPASTNASSSSPSSSSPSFSSFRLELNLYRLAMCLLDAGEVSSLLLAAQKEQQTKAKDAAEATWRQEAWGIMRGVAAAWLDGLWHRFLKGVDALTAMRKKTEESADNKSSRAGKTLLALRCLLHRYLPRARLQLLRQLNEAVPARNGFQIAPDLARMLHLMVTTTGTDADSERNDGEAEAALKGVFRTAQLCLQLKLPVKWYVDSADPRQKTLMDKTVTTTTSKAEASNSNEDSTVIVALDATTLIRLRREALSTAAAAAAAAAASPPPPPLLSSLDLRVFFDKTIDLDPQNTSGGGASAATATEGTGMGMGMRLLIALTPVREDDLVGWPPIDKDVADRRRQHHHHHHHHHHHWFASAVRLEAEGPGSLSGSAASSEAVW